MNRVWLYDSYPLHERVWTEPYEITDKQIIENHYPWVIDSEKHGYTTKEAFEILLELCIQDFVVKNNAWQKD